MFGILKAIDNRKIQPYNLPLKHLLHLFEAVLVLRDEEPQILLPKSTPYRVQEFLQHLPQTKLQGSSGLSLRLQLRDPEVFTQ